MRINGNNRIVFIKQSGVYKPVGCLTNNGFEEQTELFETTTRNGEGWRTFIPDLQQFSINLEGVIVVGESGLISFNQLRALKRARVRVSWGIGEDVENLDQVGLGYINAISEEAEVNIDATFSATIQGWGAPQEDLQALGVNLEDFLEDGEGNLIST